MPGIVSLICSLDPSVCVIREPPVKKTLYWCRRCNVPLLGKGCACGAEGMPIPLLRPYDVRPALAADRALIKKLVEKTFGNVPIPTILLLNKTGGVDRADLVIANGNRFGWLAFDPVRRAFRFDLAPEALPSILPSASRGIIDLEREAGDAINRRVGGKKFPLKTMVPDGTVIVKYRNKFGTGTVAAGSVRIKEVSTVKTESHPDPGWEVAVDRNRYHLRNLERTAVRMIRQHMNDRPTANVSFSGGKDSTAVLNLARKAGITSAFFIDTGLEFPETIAFVREQGVETVPPAGDFWQAVEKAGPPGKDNRWCCKLLKLRPLKLYLAKIGPCVTVQGNRWYESWNRANLDETSQNPDNPLQLNISPIRNWRALEVFLYLWWQKIPTNPLYDKGIERIGCYLCPSMLESEYEELKSLHPAYAKRWEEFLQRWSEKKGLPGAYSRWGLWRWKELPRKMREICSSNGIALNEDFSVKATGTPTKAALCRSTGSGVTGMKQAAGQPESYPVGTIRKDFRIVADLIYLDNAATSFSPEPVIQTLVEFEHRYRANVGRGVHRLTQIASQKYWHAHGKVARFVGGEQGVTVFTKNTTEAINMVAQGIAWKRGDRVITTILEHHSNLLPWLNLAQKGVSLDIIGINEDYSLDLSALEDALTRPARLVAVTHASNVLGVVTPVTEIARICHDHGALLLIDAAQTVPHQPVDLGAIGCDFAAFSGHKMLGPTGTGVLWMKEPVLEPSVVGGGMVDTVTGTSFTTAEGYQKYEAGTPNIGGGIALGAAADYLSAIGMEKIHAHEQELTTRLIDGLSAIGHVQVYAPASPMERIGVVSFTIAGLHPHEVAARLDEESDIMVRSGHHCCQPLMQRLNLPEGTVRASLALYTTKDEVDLLVAAVSQIAGGV